jgi:hypothetical protein
VVIAIIGILIALLLPAVQAAREAARRVQCTNHLKQIGLALHNYEDTYNVLPYGSSYRKRGGTWAAFILPYIEQQALYDKFDFSLEQTHPANEEAVTTPVGTLICPSDASVGEAIMGHRCLYVGSGPVRAHVLWYPASMGPTAPDFCVYCPPGPGSYCCQGGSYGSSPPGAFTGMFGRVVIPVRFAAVLDGLSNTLMVGESIPSHCFHNTAFGKNFPIAGTSIPLNTMVGEEGQGDDWSQEQLHQDNPHYRACGFKSRHPGGAVFCLGDGGVHFISESIDYRLYNELGSRAGGEAVTVP